jgi:hypothetical protein
MFRPSCCSFGRDFLAILSPRRFSWSRSVRLFLAARRRWPGGFLRVGWGRSGPWAGWFVPDVPDCSGPLCGVLFSFADWPWRA